MKLDKIAAFAIGPIGGATLGFITVPIITWYFSVEDIGRISMLQVVVSFSILLFSLGLDQAYVREYHESSNKPQLLKNTLIPGFLLLSIFLIISFYFSYSISYYLFDLESLKLAYLVLICVIVAFISRFLSLVLRMQEKGLAFSLSLVLPKGAFLLLISGYVLLDSGFTTFQLIAAHTLSLSSVCLLYLWNTRADWLAAFKEKLDFRKISSMSKYSTPLILGGVAYWGLTAIDKIFLRSFSNLEQLGVYSVAVNFAAVATIFQSIFTTIWMPIVYKWVSTDTNLYKINGVIRYILFFVVLIFCLVGLFSWLIDYILPAEYNEVKYIVVACLGFPLLYTLSETTVVGINITRKTFYALTASVIALLVNLIGNYWLIPLHGAAGAASSTCVAFWVFLVCRTEFSIRVWRPFPRLALYFLSFGCVVFSVIMSIFGEQINTLLLYAWIFMLFFLVILYHKLIREIFIWCIK